MITSLSSYTAVSRLHPTSRSIQRRIFTCILFHVQRLQWAHTWIEIVLRITSFLGPSSFPHLEAYHELCSLLLPVYRWSACWAWNRVSWHINTCFWMLTLSYWAGLSLFFFWNLGLLSKHCYKTLTKYILLVCTPTLQSVSVLCVHCPTHLMPLLHHCTTTNSP